MATAPLRGSRRGRTAWDTWLSAATDTQLACRDARHSWQPGTVDYHRVGQVYETVEVCDRGCGTTRRRFVSARTGELLTAPAYRYAEGFLAKGTGAFGGDHRGAARLARWQRLYETRGRWPAGDGEQ